MDDKLEQKYLTWLEHQVSAHNGRSYWELLECMHNKEFIWIIPNDDNRVADGLDVRNEFFRTHGVYSRGCSVLEVLIGISRRLEFILGGDPRQWAWKLIEHLELHKMSGHIGRVRANQIDDILETLIWRTYAPDGGGGFFPLAWPKQDQRKIEIWYQMAAWCEELEISEL